MLRKIIRRVKSWFKSKFKLHEHSWVFRSTARILHEDEPFIQLYYYLSNGGCKDFTEHIVYIGEPDEMEIDYSNHYSYLKFRADNYKPGYAHFFPLTLGVVNLYRNENISDGCEIYFKNLYDIV